MDTDTTKIPQPLLDSAPLSPEWTDYLAARGVTPEAARARGYREVHGGNPLDGDYANTYGFPKVRGGLLIPLHPLLGGEAYQLRFKPGSEPLDRKGNPRKFDTPGGQRNVMATSPLTRDLLDAPRQAIVIAEGITRVDAVAPLGIPAVGIPGVWSWRGTNAKGGKTALADFDSLAIEGNIFILAYDADMRTNADVNAAALRLATLLLGRGAASVCTLALPDGMGLDDWVAAQRSAGIDDDAIRLAFAALRSELPGRPLKATGKPRLYGGDRMQRSSLLQESLDVLASSNTGADGLPILYRADISDDGAGRVVQRDKADTVRYAPLSAGEYYYRMVEAADWYVVDKDGNEQDHHPPRDLAELLTLAQPDARLPVLEGIYTHAVLIANEQGQPALLATPGYHEGAGVIIAGTEAPPFPPDADPVAALLEDLLLDFPSRRRPTRRTRWPLA